VTRAAGLGLLVAFTALAVVGRMAFLWAPNVALTYLVVFLAGVGYGVRFGALVGLLAMLITNFLLTGLHPVLLVNSPAMALLGAAGGLLGRVVNFGQLKDEPPVFAAGLAAFTGFTATLLFSVATDTTQYLLFSYLPTGIWAPGYLGLLVGQGLLFNAIPAVVNAALFAVGAYPVLRALRQAGYLRQRTPASAATG